jgi:hypothetical protein
MSSLSDSGCRNGTADLLSRERAGAPLSLLFDVQVAQFHQTWQWATVAHGPHQSTSMKGERTPTPASKKSQCLRAAPACHTLVMDLASAHSSACGAVASPMMSDHMMHVLASSHKPPEVLLYRLKPVHYTGRGEPFTTAALLWRCCTHACKM